MMLVLLFDDDCLVCNRSVQFLLERDGGALMFAALQGEYGKKIVAEHGLQHIDSVVFVENGHVYTHSTAVLRALRYVPKWRVLSLLRIIPKSFRDIVYKYIARNRHRVPLQQCMLLTREQRTRFLP
ncbi:MAG: DCC1-like thiol-disulfide oxidoreductase family protein [Lysinibacillus sp.]